jgi:hypothetical protein
MIQPKGLMQQSTIESKLEIENATWSHIVRFGRPQH